MKAGRIIATMWAIKWTFPTSWPPFLCLPLIREVRGSTHVGPLLSLGSAKL
jgi:hypothetical protein